MSCLISDGVGINCDALNRVGGVNKRAYLFNLNDLTSSGLDANGYIDNLVFTAYLGLYKYISRKQAHSGGSTAQIQAPGGNKFYQHDVILKLFPDTPTEDTALEKLLVSCVGIILEDNNKEFLMYGLDNGMDQSEGVQNTGQEQNSDMANSLTFIGSEPDLPKRILINGSYANTKAALDSWVV